MTLNYMPINISMKKRRCLVVGGGPVALRKAENLMDYETDLTVIAPEIHEKLQYHAERGKVTLVKREYQSPEASGFGIVISASDDREVNKRVAADCSVAGVPVNVVDDPALCDFIFPAVVKRDCLTAAIATDGKAPFVAGHLRTIMGNIFPEHWSKLMRHAVAFRKKVRERWAEDHDRKMDCYARFLEADWKTMLKESSPEEIERELDNMLESEEPQPGDAPKGFEV
ncbi:MAG: bifunctional precorrin-2 dehydrogenase/sirohydrochlorin ferrochelatase [Candidatus Zixiibacteriota bacterium]|nr:MAG: bifunctional precorrin-2 dehydrogenase/sirohydrochlorin ferrochelatase [candidate division Zixibacteria bacterium]